MKQLKFRPLRLVKKTGKITVASYSQWRSLYLANYEKFQLVLSEDHLKMNPHDQVYNYKGEPS